ncbi:hypothetical protein J7443_13290, partial [Tropicibacter sp. R15_0]|uniref:hypothetical protein n=1 Tax=Tropicibacter sp. R15_0 TaxID=2821101 RepID=UPI001AD9BB2A
RPPRTRQNRTHPARSIFEEMDQPMGLCLPLRLMTGVEPVSERLLGVCLGRAGICQRICDHGTV